MHSVTPKHKLLELQRRTRLPIFYSAFCEQGISNCLYITMAFRHYLTYAISSARYFSCQKNVVSFNTFFPSNRRSLF